MNQTQSKQLPLIMAVIPAWNEANHIGAVVAATAQHMPVIVVDDGSSDSTVAEAIANGAEVIEHKRNKGKGAALRTGFRAAMLRGADAVITLDADGQHDPHEIPSFIRRYQEMRSDLLLGVRNFRKMPIQRRLANLFGYWSFSWAIGRKIRDNQSGYRLLSRRMMENMIHCGETGFAFEVDMIVTCIKRKLTFDWIPIETIYADERSHIQGVTHFLSFMRMLWQTWFTIPYDMRQRHWYAS